MERRRDSRRRLLTPRAEPAILHPRRLSDLGGGLGRKGDGRCLRAVSALKGLAPAQADRAMASRALTRTAPTRISTAAAVAKLANHS